MRRILKTFFKLGLVASSIAFIIGQANAAPITWTDWTTADGTSASGTAGGVSVSFSGLLNPSAQTNGGTNYWANNSSTYTSNPEVDNAPPDSDIIRLTGGSAAGVQTITFSQAVIDPVMAIMSMGQSGLPVQYVFDTPFDILNVGPGYFGNGTLVELAGNILEGREGHGIIQFQGPVTSISWTIPTAESWHGFQIGIVGVANNDIPVPATLPLLGIALAGLAFARRRP